MPEVLRAPGKAGFHVFVVVGLDRDRGIADGRARRSRCGADETVRAQAGIELMASHPRPAVQVSRCAGQRGQGSSRRGP